MFKRLRIWYLKRRAKVYYSQYIASCDDLDCSPAFISNINPHPAFNFNRMLDKLAKLDPNCPKNRL